MKSAAEKTTNARIKLKNSSLKHHPQPLAFLNICLSFFQFNTSMQRIKKFFHQHTQKKVKLQTK